MFCNNWDFCKEYISKITLQLSYDSEEGNIYPYSNFEFEVLDFEFEDDSRTDSVYSENQCLKIY